MGNTQKKMLCELKDVNCNYIDINDIYKHSLPPTCVNIILKWLPFIYQEHIGNGEHLLRSLISAQEPFDPSVIIDLFEKSDYNISLKNSMAYVLAIAKTYDISEWIRDQLLNKDSSFERSGLLYALEVKTGIRDKDEFMRFLKSLFDKYFSFEIYRKLFKKYARTSDVEFLEAKLRNPDLTNYRAFLKESDQFFGDNKAAHADTRFERELSKLIQDINKRKKVFQFPPSKPLGT